MTNVPSGTEILSQEACWNLLEGAAVGRLAVDVGGQPDIFPINFVVDGNCIVFRSGAGTKLAASVLMRHVAFEIDGYEPLARTAWSVVVKGRAHEIERMAEVYAAEDLPLFPWVADPKPNLVRIIPEETTGRRFHVVDDVAPDSSIGWEPVVVAEEGVAPAPSTEFHPGAPYMRPS
jgi:uncharacterized protein